MAGGGLRVKKPRAAIVGAGMSGLVCARALHDADWDVRVFDKGREVGGRMSTRLHRDGTTFDHGAQYFTVRDKRFAAAVKSWKSSGILVPWDARIVTLGGSRGEPPKKRRLVGTPGMNALCLDLAVDLPIGRQVRVAELERDEDDGIWTLTDASEETYEPFDWVVLAMPPSQAAALAPLDSSIAQRAEQARMRPCWAVLLAVSEPLGLGYDAAFVDDSALSWIARTSSKPEREAEPERWVLHASAEWSERRLEDDADTVLADLLQAFEDEAGVRVGVESAVAHRWRFAIPAAPLAEECLLDADLRLGACGDWCAGPRVEGAFLSGTAMARRILESTK